MPNKYSAYIKVGKALKSGDQKIASSIAKIIIKSDRLNKKRGVLFDEKLLLSRDDKKKLNTHDLW